MTHNTLPPFVQFLLRPESYAHPVDRVELVQTHISYVFLAGDCVYKFKKPVNFGFLDFSDAAKRHFYCEQELLLNRITRIQGVTGVQSSFVLRKVVDTTVLPV